MPCLKASSVGTRGRVWAGIGNWLMKSLTRRLYMRGGWGNRRWLLPQRSCNASMNAARFSMQQVINKQYGVGSRGSRMPSTVWPCCRVWRGSTWVDRKGRGRGVGGDSIIVRGAGRWEPLFLPGLQGTAVVLAAHQFELQPAFDINARASVRSRFAGTRPCRR